MRTIKFRGKSAHSGEWNYGNLRIYGDRAFISPTYHLGKTNNPPEEEVDPDTVGQFTGITNDFKDELYEGDILRGTNALDETKTGAIIFHGCAFWHSGSSYGWEGEQMISLGGSKLLGNIHDNPEMIKQ